MLFAIVPIVTIALVFLPYNTIAAPIPDGGASYSGVGGNASGGNVVTSTSPSGDGLSSFGLLGGDSSDGLGDLMGGRPILSMFSGNAGNGGSALSGAANGGDGGVNGGTGAGSGGASYTGAGGNAAGGSVTGPAGLIQLFSDNAGNAGSANSGISQSGNS
ncbi:hypothetical protein FRB94_010540 [Tulasnella sp. JGI-2019a]|nr:hypothetical protein FRB94_010540 [Tulasnella sp. JGI-2019a]KAG9017908.1 hypothetical protein FRB93_004719 [Tulasnella sp. JGI-2019a]KAG9039069.1 hypothetical protein FRB95_012780 [Tulasnella sp. JGI-2019a]